ncbi:MAG: PASTA domain-containing protein [Bacteroidales bacterium]
MALKTRVVGAGKLLILLVALATTYLGFAAGAARIALRTREVKVPDLAGRMLNDATAQLEDMGLAVKVDDARRPDLKMAAGRIVAQEPAAGGTVRKGRTIRLWLSAGARVAKVPDLVGDAERTAELRLQQDGLAVSSIAEIRSNDYPPDVVVAQEPPANASAMQVSLLVNRSDRGATYVMPDLIGVNGERAADVLRAKGLRVAVVGRQPYPGVPTGIVLRQSPQAGFQVAPGEPISLEVSR